MNKKLKIVNRFKCKDNDNILGFDDTNTEDVEILISDVCETSAIIIGFKDLEIFLNNNGYRLIRKTK